MGRPMATSQDFANWICSDRIDRRFLVYLFLAEQDSLLRFASGAIHQTIYYPELKAFHICLPSLAEQRRIVSILDEAFAGLATATANAEKNLKNARELFESYLTSVFTRKRGGWKTSELGKEVRFIDYRGKTPPKMEAGIRLITAKNVKMNHIQRDPEEFIDANVYDGWMTRGYPKKGDVLFTTEAPLGNVAQLDTDETVVIGQRLITMQPNDGALDRTFLKYALMSRPTQAEILKRGTGATVVGIKASLLKQVPISFPEKPSDQLALAKEMEDAAKCAAQLGENYRRKISELTALKQSVLRKSFSGELTSARSQVINEAAE
jgi:type I restriction enzyme S subunit